MIPRFLSWEMMLADAEDRAARDIAQRAKTKQTAAQEAARIANFSRGRRAANARVKAAGEGVHKES